MRRLLALLTLCVWPVLGAAQNVGGPLSQGVVQSPILVIDFERVFSASAFGKRIISEIEEEGSQLAAENRRIETELSEEERRLTQQRADLPSADFRTLAAAFDEKVQRMRREQDTKAREVSGKPDAARRQFITIARPILRQIMQDSGAALILERRAVFDWVSAIDVTDLATARIDAQIGDGRDLPQLQVAPEIEGSQDR